MAKEYEYKAKYDRDLKISYAQAWNLAVQSCLQQQKVPMFPEDWTLEERHQYFFEKLTAGWTAYAESVDEANEAGVEKEHQPKPSVIESSDQLSMT